MVNDIKFKMLYGLEGVTVVGKTLGRQRTY